MSVHYGPQRRTYEEVTFVCPDGFTTITSINSITANMFKTISHAIWDSQVYCLTPFQAPCTIEFNKQAGTIDNGVGYAMISWNTDPLTNASYDSLSYQGYPYAQNEYIAYNGLTGISTGKTWDSAKKLYITYDQDGYIRHYNGDKLLYEVNFGVGNFVYFDTSFYSVNATYGGFSNVRIIKRSWNGVTYL